MANRNAKNLPYKGINTEKNNGLSSSQEVNYAKEFKAATKAGYPDEVKQDNRENQ
ncbi:YfhE family protein [Bacillus salacetis]|uniref:YfhE family protein n=1 Tax=Bacillus salacetis TaxID=2315464 RepID=A0A3A1R6H4_9BACI|nr:YfhE family protein [Bacillus salacetis]RIW38438.1 YfhE family protein [Bacillus salacetis]